MTVLDNSPRQLERDALVAQTHRLPIKTVLGDMADLAMLREGSFDLIVHPVSNCFVPDIRSVWNEAFRVLRPGGCLLSGFNNPVLYIFDQDLAEQTGRLEVKHSLPYSDVDRLTAEALERRRKDGVPVEFSHTLEEQIGGQIAAGFCHYGYVRRLRSAGRTQSP